MPLKNTTRQYGSVAKFLHWTIAILVIAQYYWVYWKRYMLPEGSELGMTYIRTYHKPLGVCILFLGVFFLAWRHLNTKPAFPNSMPNWQRQLAQAVHWLIYISLLVMPISGVAMSMAAGYPVSLFGYAEIPMWLEKDEPLSHTLYAIHKYCSFVVIGLAVLHVAGALKHHFIEKDTVLRRMLPFVKIK